MEKDFEYINNTYWDIFGFSYLNVFLDTSPEKWAFSWHVKRWTAILFVFAYYPMFIFLQISGTASNDSNNLMSIAFTLSFASHNIQNFLKMGYFLTHLRKIRSFCLDFSQFNTSTHRPILSKSVLGENATFMRKIASRCYFTSYANIVFWVVVPTVTSLIFYILYISGKAEPLPSYIPRYSIVILPYENNTLPRQCFTASVEIIMFTFGFFYFQPIDMFFASTIYMVKAQTMVLNTSLLRLPHEISEYWGEKCNIIDRAEPISIELFVQDHQKLIRYNKRLRKLMNFILGLVVCNCLTIIANTSIVIFGIIDKHGFRKQGLEVTAHSFIIATTLSVFYMYCWMCDVLKSAEESIYSAVYSCNWYERDPSFRKSLLLIMRQTMKAPPVRILGIGDMGKGTFIDGLRLIYSFFNFMQRFK